MDRAFEQNRSEMINKERRLYCLHKTGTIVPCLMVVKIVPDTSDGIKLLGLLCPDNDQSSYYEDTFGIIRKAGRLLVNADNGEILGVSQECLSFSIPPSISYGICTDLNVGTLDGLIEDASPSTEFSDILRGKEWRRSGKSVRLNVVGKHTYVSDHAVSILELDIKEVCNKKVTLAEVDIRDKINQNNTKNLPVLDQESVVLDGNSNISDELDNIEENLHQDRLRRLYEKNNMLLSGKHSKGVKSINVYISLMLAVWVSTAFILASTEYNVIGHIEYALILGCVMKKREATIPDIVIGKNQMATLFNNYSRQNLTSIEKMKMAELSSIYATDINSKIELLKKSQEQCEIYFSKHPNTRNSDASYKFISPFIGQYAISLSTSDAIFAFISSIDEIMANYAIPALAKTESIEDHIYFIDTNRVDPFETNLHGENDMMLKRYTELLKAYRDWSRWCMAACATLQIIALVVLALGVRKVDVRIKYKAVPLAYISSEVIKQLQRRCDLFKLQCLDSGEILKHVSVKFEEKLQLALPEEDSIKPEKDFSHFNVFKGSSRKLFSVTTPKMSSKRDVPHSNNNLQPPEKPYPYLSGFSNNHSIRSIIGLEKLEANYQSQQQEFADADHFDRLEVVNPEFPLATAESERPPLFTDAEERESKRSVRIGSRRDALIQPQFIKKVLGSIIPSMKQIEEQNEAKKSNTLLAAVTKKQQIMNRKRDKRRSGKLFESSRAQRPLSQDRSTDDLEEATQEKIESLSSYSFGHGKSLTKRYLISLALVAPLLLYRLLSLFSAVTTFNVASQFMDLHMELRDEISDNGADFWSSVSQDAQEDRIESLYAVLRELRDFPATGFSHPINLFFESTQAVINNNACDTLRSSSQIKSECESNEYLKRGLATSIYHLAELSAQGKDNSTVLLAEYLESRNIIVANLTSLLAQVIDGHGGVFESYVREFATYYYWISAGCYCGEAIMLIASWLFVWRLFLRRLENEVWLGSRLLAIVPAEVAAKCDPIYNAIVTSNF